MHKRSTAVIVSRHRTRRFLFESMLQDQFETVIHVHDPQRAIDVVLGGVEPEVVMVDVDLYDQPGAASAAAASLRLVAGDAAVIEVGEHLGPGGDDLDQILGVAVPRT